MNRRFALFLFALVFLAILPTLSNAATESCAGGSFFSPTSNLDYGNVQLGSTAVLSVDIQSFGGNFLVKGVTSTNSDFFPVTAIPFCIKGNGTTHIQIGFKPTQIGLIT